ncbi:MAG: YkgJ family cysteine cluster protein [Halarchaeum sp.]
MEVDCEGCAGCCVDWQPLADGTVDHERRGPRAPLDDAYNLVPLTREDVRAFVDAGHAAALTPRLWAAAEGDDAVTIDGREIAAISGKPVFFVGIRKPPKPVGPFDTDPRWLPTCAFLDPETLQCRVHDADVYPEACATYPGDNLALGAETECERVEAAFGGTRLLDDAAPDDAGVLLGPQAVGQTVFCYPDPDELDGVLESVLSDGLSRETRASFVGVAAASAPGTTRVASEKREEYEERARERTSWVDDALDEWAARAEEETPDPALGRTVEESRGAPATPGWEG